MTYPMGYTIAPHPDGDAPQLATCKRCHAEYVSVRVAVLREGQPMQEMRSPRCPPCERVHIRGMVV